MEKMEVIDYKIEGDSFPIIVADGMQKLFVKLKAGMSGEYSLLSEWFGNVIGEKLGVNTRHPHWIRLTNSLKYNNVYIEVRDLIEKSWGVNICFEYIENIRDFTLIESDSIDKKKYIDIYLLDVLMLNVDRNSINPNLILDCNDNLIVSDFESSLLFNEIFKSPLISNDKRILQSLRANPFYQKVGRKELDNFVNRLNVIDFEPLVSHLPNETISDRDKQKLLKSLENKKINNWGLLELLEKVDFINIETTSEREIRINRNREQLEKLVNSTHNKEK